MAMYEKQKTDGFHMITGLLVEIDQANVSFTNPIDVYGKEFEAAAVLKLTPKGLMADITIKGKYDPSLTPEIALSPTIKTFDLNGKQTSSQGKIVGLFLKKKPNVDPRIKSIAEQLKTK